MKELQERIKKDGIAVNEDILKVDSFINHQVDPVLMQHIGEAFAEHFKDQGITKVHGQNASVHKNCTSVYILQFPFFSGMFLKIHRRSGSVFRYT